MNTIPTPGGKELRRFGLLLGAPIVLVFGVAVPWLRDSAFPIWPWVLAGLLAVVALARPGVLRPIYRGWMRFGHLMNWLISRVTLFVVYYAMVVPMALIMRVCRKDPMRRSLEHAAMTYRVPSPRLDRKHLERPF